MARWTLANIMSTVTTRAGRRSDLAASTVSFWVNEAYIGFVKDVPELLSEKTTAFSVSSGDSLLSLPADFREVINLSETSSAAGRNRDLRQISPEHADSAGYFPVGIPTGYFLYGPHIQLHPSSNSQAPDSEDPRLLFLRYRWIPTEMSLATATPSIATEHVMGIVFKAEQYIHELVGNLEEAAGAEIRYTSFVLSLKDAIARRHAARGPMTVSIPYSRSRRDGDLRDQDEWLRR